MKRAAFAALCCVLALLAAACGPTVISAVERQRVNGEPVEQPQPAAEAEQVNNLIPATDGGGYTAPTFPADYRMRIAVSLAPAYVDQGRGPPEITPLKSTAPGVFGASTSVCVHYPIDMALLVPASTWAGRRTVFFRAARNWSTGGKTAMTRTTNNKRYAAPCQGPVEPFPELEQIAQKYRDCLARKETRCVVYEVPGRKHIIYTVDRNKPAAAKEAVE
jgi:hypothetical protein